jgi:hypothetical protein
VFTAISAAATVAPAKAVFVARRAFPRSPASSHAVLPPAVGAASHTSRWSAHPVLAKVSPQRSQYSAGLPPPEDICRVPQRPRWSSAQQRKHRFQSIGRGQSRQDPCLLWQRFQPAPCRLFDPRRLAAGQFSAEFIYPTQGCQTAQFPANAHANQAEPSQQNHKASPIQCAPVVERRTYQPGSPQNGKTERKDPCSDKGWRRSPANRLRRRRD